MTRFSAWDNLGKGNADRYTVSKDGRVFVVNTRGEWEYICSEREVDHIWMSKYQLPISFKNLPVEIQKAVEQMVFP